MLEDSLILKDGTVIKTGDVVKIRPRSYIFVTKEDGSTYKESIGEKGKFVFLCKEVKQGGILVRELNGFGTIFIPYGCKPRVGKYGTHIFPSEIIVPTRKLKGVKRLKKTVPPPEAKVIGKELEKRKRGRPPKKVETVVQEKRKRGRPRKNKEK